MTTDKLQEFVWAIDLFTKAAIKIQAALAEHIAHTFTTGITVSVPNGPSATLDLTVFGITVRIRPEVVTKTNPPSIGAKLVAYLVTKDAQSEHLEQIGQAVDFYQDGTINGTNITAFPHQFTEQLLTALFDKAGLKFTP